MMIAFPFNPRDWYWQSTDGRIYSSARNQLVYNYDSGLLFFMNKYGNPTPWPTDITGKQTSKALQDVLAAYGIIVTL